MNARTLTAILILVTATTVAHGDDPDAKNKAIRELLAVQGAADNAVKMIDVMIDNFKRAQPDVDPAFWDAFKKKVDVQELIDLIVPVYAKHFTLEEVRQIRAFYDSPVGRKFVALTPQLMQESMAAGQQWGRKIAQQALEELQQQKAATEETP